MEIAGIKNRKIVQDYLSTLKCWIRSPHGTVSRKDTLKWMRSNFIVTRNHTYSKDVALGAKATFKEGVNWGINPAPIAGYSMKTFDNGESFIVPAHLQHIFAE